MGRADSRKTAVRGDFAFDRKDVAVSIPTSTDRHFGLPMGKPLEPLAKVCRAARRLECHPWRDGVVQDLLWLIALSVMVIGVCWNWQASLVVGAMLLISHSDVIPERKLHPPGQWTAIAIVRFLPGLLALLLAWLAAANAGLLC